MNKLVVISGCSGGGKSTLISELSNHGYTVINEVGRKLVKEQLAAKTEITPWQNPKAFCELLIEESVTAFQSAAKIKNAKNNIIFFDRCFLEGICYYQTLKINDANKYNNIIDEFRYYHTIFMTPPWPEIFCQDEERQHNFNDALDEYQRLVEGYPKFGYKIIEIPKINVTDRVKFIFSNI